MLRIFVCVGIVEVELVSLEKITLNHSIPGAMIHAPFQSCIFMRFFQVRCILHPKKAVPSAVFYRALYCCRVTLSRNFRLSALHDLGFSDNSVSSFCMSLFYRTLDGPDLVLVPYGSGSWSKLVIKL